MTQSIHSCVAYLGDLRVDVRQEMIDAGEPLEFVDAFLEHTGIETAWLCGSEDLTSLASAAAYDAVTLAGPVAQIICVTQTFEPRSPGLGFVICEQLGWKLPVLEINSACQGFAEAMALAGKFNGRSLIVCADSLGSHVRRTSSERSMRYLFSDAASAVVVSGLSVATSRYHPELWHNLCISSNSSWMDGESIAFAACRFVPDALKSFMRDSDRLMLHQANRSIVERIGRRVGRHTPCCISDYANCSSSSIPIALAHFKANGPHTLCGYGAGFALCAVRADIDALYKLVV